jgi:opacity protein-like surface antigen
VKRIAIVLIAFSFVANPARANTITGVAGGLATGGISAILCTLTTMYGWGEGDSPNEGFDRRGMFFGVSGAYAGENFSNRPMKDFVDVFGAGTSATADDSWSVKGRGGYRCNPRFSVGATFEYFGGFDTDWSGAKGTGSDDIDVFAVTADIKGFLLTGRYQPYLLFGGGVMGASTKLSDPARPQVTQSRDPKDFVFRFGGGFDFFATEHVVVNIDVNYLAPLGDISGIQIYTVGWGLEYRF